jgi:fructokinase
MSAPGVEVVCLGEALVDLVSTKAGVRLDRAPAFRKAAGGAPANVSVGLARLGVRSAFIGAFGVDSLGAFLTATLARAGVDLTPTCHSKGPTALALVSLAADGDRDFLFYGDQPAHFDLRLTPRMRAAVRSARIFHFGSISLIAEPARSATLAAIDEARRAGALVSYDPNLRLNLWPNIHVARQAIRTTLPLADILKVNEDELAFLTATRSVAAGLAALSAMGPRLVVATLGAAGCAYRFPGGEGKVAGFPARAVDTTGAGDAFVAGLLHGLLSNPDVIAVSSAGGELEAILTYANAAAALSTERRGGIPSLPTRRRVRAFLAANTR